MSLGDGLRGSMQEETKSKKRRGPYSKAYHRYFEGYSEIAVPKPDGKGTRIERIYTGNYFRQDLTDRQRILIRVLYATMFLCMAFLNVSSAAAPLPLNSTWYVVLPQAVSLPFLVWILITLLRYLPAERDMKIADYRDASRHLLKAALGAAIGLGVTALTSLVFILLNPPDASPRALLCAGEFALAGAIALAMNRIERKVVYRTIPNPARPPEGSYEIR